MIQEKISFNDKIFQWYRYNEPLTILNADDINNIQHNIQVLKEIAEEKSYVVDDIKDVNANYSTPLIEIVDILNNIEYNLDVINIPPLVSLNYNQSVRAVAGQLAHNKDDIWRWILIINDILDMLLENKGKWVLLQCSDGIPTIKNKPIALRGEYI